MMQLSSNDSSLCYDVIITHQILKFEKFGDFSCDIDYNSRTDIFSDDISLIVKQWTPAAHFKHAMCACCNYNIMFNNKEGYVNIFTTFNEYQKYFRDMLPKVEMGWGEYRIASNKRPGAYLFHAPFRPGAYSSPGAYFFHSLF